MSPSERSPLLSSSSNSSIAPPHAKPTAKASTSWLSRVFSPANRVLLAGFIISLSFSFTQVSMLYVFRQMVCQDFYKTHPVPPGLHDKCSRPEVAAGTSVQFALTGLSTTTCGTLNLFVSGYQIKILGPSRALILQVLVPAVRVAAQILGVMAGGMPGIWIIQATQIITIFGGPAGYILVTNTILGEVVRPVQRTAYFGRLQGCIMGGVAAGYWLGGQIGDRFGVVRPFQTAFVSFCLAGLYARIFIPYISPDDMPDSKKATTGLAGFFAPLKVLQPQIIRLASGVLKKHYGVFFLCFGNFIGVLATGYAPTLLQMFATSDFDFSQADNGLLMSVNALMRALFLIFIFPRIIGRGRQWFASIEEREAQKSNGHLQNGVGDSQHVKRRRSSAVVEQVLPETLREYPAPMGTQSTEEPVILGRTESRDQQDDGQGEEEADPEENASFEFDLFFLRWSLILDGALTAGAAFATQSWHVYLAAFLFPFGSGSAPAAKGVITAMCPSSQRADALNAVTLIENIARLATLGVFGFVFSSFVSMGAAYLTFFVNGAIAVVGMLILLFSHFPPRGSTLIDDDDNDTTGLVPSAQAQQ